MFQLGSLCHCIRGKKIGCKAAPLLGLGGTKIEGMDVTTHVDIIKHTALRVDVLLSYTLGS